MIKKTVSQDPAQKGLSREDLKRLCDLHLKLMKKGRGTKLKPARLPASHPVSICKDEHKIIKRNLKNLKRTFDRISRLQSFEKARRQVNTLKELSHFFLETEKHHRREEEALFPPLAAHGITEPPQILKEDHVEFLAKKKELYRLMMSEGKELRELVGAIAPIIGFLAKNLEDHIYKEDNILYPMLLETLGKSEWKEARRKFDAIGYCCFAPADLKKKKRG